MAVYVDPLQKCIPTRRWRYTQACHLIGDSLIELHRFAALIGLQRAWFQSKSYPHYDLTPGKREQAVRRGARELTRREFVQKMKEGREAGQDAASQGRTTRN